MIAKTVHFLEQRNFLLVTLVVTILMLGGTAYSIRLGDKLRFLPDESDYTTLAHNLIMRGIYSLDGIHPTAYRAPGYPFVLALFAFLGVQVTGFRILNFVFLILSLLVANHMLCREAGKLAGILGVFILAVYGVLFYTAGTLYPQTLAALLLMAALDRWTKPGASRLDILLGGTALGGLILTVPTYAFIPFAIGGWYLITRQKVASLWIGFVVMVLLVGVWVARNCFVFHEFVFITSNSGEMLLYGNSENTIPNSGPNVDIHLYVQEADKLHLNEVQRDQYYRQKALEYIQSHKLESLRLYLLKFINYFNYRNQLVTTSESSQVNDLLMLVTFGPLLCIFFLRWLLIKWYHPDGFEILLSGLYLLGGFIQAVFFTRIRYRLPFDYLLILSVAMFSAQLLIDWSRTTKVPDRTLESILR